MSGNATTHACPIALVTGARRGLGRAIASSLADAGYNLVISDIKDDADTNKTLDNLLKKNVSVEFIQHDLSDIAGHKAFIAKATAAFGPIDCLVNNAGIQVPRRVGLLEVEPDEFDQVVDVNLRGTFFLTQEFARAMIACSGDNRGQPRTIISITSANAAIASTDKAAYCLTKSALSMMTALFALELGKYGICVFEVRPGLMETDMTLGVRDKYSDYVSQNTLFGRWGRPAEVGRAVAALASGAIPYSSGEIINVDGGMHIRRL